MWKVAPNLLCRQHLLGEHFEMHCFAGAFIQGKPLTHYIKYGFVELHNLHTRHDELRDEMIKRGYHHQSPIPDFITPREGHVDSFENLATLKNKCPECKKRMKEKEHEHEHASRSATSAKMLHL